MPYFTAPPVVVGYDGSRTAKAALILAAGEAGRRARSLWIVYAQEIGPALETRTPDDLLHEARHLVRPLLPPTRIVQRIRIGGAARILTEESIGAELLVVGRGELGALGALAGSVAIDAICQARCPVVVVAERRGRTWHDGAVVAGIDPDHCEDVLAAAFREAELRHQDLIVLHACGGSHSPGAGYLGACQDGVERPSPLRDAVHPFQAKHPSVAVTEICQTGRPRRVLNAASAAATLLVVGARGHCPVAGLILGSVGQSLVRHADCPVMIVRSGAAHPEPVSLVPSTGEFELDFQTA